jgi:hypothetical protein
MNLNVKQLCKIIKNAFQKYAVQTSELPFNLFLKSALSCIIIVLKSRLVLLLPAVLAIVLYWFLAWLICRL